MIETRGLTKRFGERLAVDAVDLSVPRASAYGFLGHNGAGKTTVIRMLLGLTTADAGTMFIGGRPLPAERAEVLAHVGAIVEEPAFHRYLTGRENLRVAAAVRGPEAHDRIEGALGRVGLSDRGRDRVGTYSQGMRQRLGIARCLLADPALLILDEPMNGLDPGGILELRELIGSLTEEGRTVFLSSHLLDEVEKTCAQAAVIDHGRIVEAGPIAALMRDDRAELEIECDEPSRAASLLSEPSRGSQRGQHRVRAAGPAHRARRRGRRQRRAGQRRHRRLAPGPGAGLAGTPFPGTHLSTGEGMNLTVARAMIGAEILKLRRSRGTMGFALVLTVGLIVVLFGFSALRHSSDPAHYPSAGGVRGFDHAVQALGLYFGMLAAILIGAEAGTVDLANGVFRNLVVTGRSRLALFAVRVPAAIIVSLVLAGVAYAIALVATFALAGSSATPGIGLILRGAGWIALCGAIFSTLATGLGSLTGSRAVTITALIGWQAVLSNLLLHTSSLGSAREALLTAPLSQIIPINADSPAVTLSLTMVVVVLAAWTVVPILLGAWRTRTQDA